MAKYLKFIIATLGAVVTVVQTVWPTSHWAVVVTTVVTAILVYLTPRSGVLQRGTAAANNGRATDRILNDADPARNWAPGEWAGWTLNITAGRGVGQSVTIVTNTKPTAARWPRPDRSSSRFGLTTSASGKFSSA